MKKIADIKIKSAKIQNKTTGNYKKNPGDITCTLLLPTVKKNGVFFTEDL